MEEEEKEKNILQSLVHFVSNLIKNFANLVVNNRYSLDDILHIIRPFIYVYSVMKFGRRSYKPIKIALAIDMVSIFVSMTRLIRSGSGKKG